MYRIKIRQPGYKLVGSDYSGQEMRMSVYSTLGKVSEILC